MESEAIQAERQDRHRAAIDIPLASRYRLPYGRLFKDAAAEFLDRCGA